MTLNELLDELGDMLAAGMPGDTVVLVEGRSCPGGIAEITYDCPMNEEGEQCGDAEILISVD